MPDTSSPIAVTLASHQLAPKTEVFGNSMSSPAQFGQSSTADESLELPVRFDFGRPIETSLHGPYSRDLPSCNGLDHVSVGGVDRTIRHSGLTCHLVGYW